MAIIQKKHNSPKKIHGLLTKNKHISDNCIQNSSSFYQKTPPRKRLSDTLGYIKIDSLRVRIPIQDVEVLDSTNFLRTVKTYEVNTFQTWDDETPQMVTQKYNLIDGVGASYAFRSFITGDDAVSRDFIVIGFSAKLLKQNYFEGINKDNIDEILEFINSEGVVKISREVFIRARIADVDFCEDCYVLHELKDSESEAIAKDMTVKTIIGMASKITRKGLDIIVHKKQANDNIGIQ